MIITHHFSGHIPTADVGVQAQTLSRLYRSSRTPFDCSLELADQ